MGLWWWVSQQWPLAESDLEAEAGQEIRWAMTPKVCPCHLCQPARSYLPTVLQLPKKGSLAEGPNIRTREPGARGEQDRAFHTQTIITFKIVHILVRQVYYSITT